MPLYTRTLVVAAALLLACGVASAAAAELTLRHGAETRTLTREAVEAVGVTRVDMRHPEGFAGRFTGVWLDDFLEAQGLHEARRVRFIAHDGYDAFLTPRQRQEKAYLLVTRLDGEPIPLKAHGPFMLVVPEDAEAVLAGTESMTRWIWSIAEVSAR